MKITMRTCAAGADFVLHPGKTYNVNSEVAKPMLDGGFAVPADASAQVTRLTRRPDPEEETAEELDE